MIFELLLIEDFDSKLLLTFLFVNLTGLSILFFQINRNGDSAHLTKGARANLLLNYHKAVINRVVGLPVRSFDLFNVKIAVSLNFSASIILFWLLRSLRHLWFAKETASSWRQTHVQLVVKHVELVVQVQIIHILKVL